MIIVGYDAFFQKRLPKSKYVEIIGEVPNSKIAGWYTNAKAFVSASRMEGFGIPPLEAMSVGCPVILSDIPVFREVNGDAAMYFNHEDPADIARVIAQTIFDKKILGEMVEKGYRQVKKYSWEKMVKETCRIYADALSLRVKRSNLV